MLWSIRENVKAADERSAGHADTITQMRLLFEEERKVKVVSSSAGLPKEELRVPKLESALEAKKVELQTLPGIAYENSTLRAEIVQLRASVETLRCRRRETVMLT